MPPAAWKSANAPATRPARNFNSANSALVHVFVEPFGVAAVVVGDEDEDSFFSGSATGFDLIEASDVAACDPDSFFVFVGCVFSMMNTFLTIELYPSSTVLFLTATRLMQGFSDNQ